MPIIEQLAKIFTALVVTIFTIYYGMRFFDSLTRNIEEWKEMKKGNVAVAILIGVVVLSVVLITSPGIYMLINSVTLTGNDNPYLVVGMGVLNYLVAFLVALFSIYITVRLLDILTSNIDKIAALKKGNVGIAVYMSAVFLSIAIIISSLVLSLLFTINLAVKNFIS